MSTITTPPLVIDAACPDTGWSDNLFAGPYLVGGKWYAIQKEPTGNRSPLIYRSSDGVTWALLETLAAVFVAFTWFWDTLGPRPSVITFAILPLGGGTFYLQDYDCSTETLGSPYGVSGGPTASTLNAGAGISRLSDGTIKLFLVKSDELFYSVNAGGVWIIVDTSILSNPGDALSLRLLTSCTDRSVDGAAFVYRYQSSIVNRLYFYQYLDVANTLSSSQQFNFTFPSDTGTAIARIYQGSDNKIYAGELTYDQGTTGSSGVGIWTLSGTLSAPTMVETLIYDFSQGGTINVNSIFCFANEVSGKPAVLVTIQDNDLGGGQDVYVYRLNFNGATWAAPVLFIDLVAHPPTTPPPTPSNDPYYYIEGLSFLSSGAVEGGLGVLLALDVQNPDESNVQTAFALIAPFSISIACPVAPLTAQVGIPFTSDPPIVTGDAPPDTFELVSGPPWMSIDPATGVVSGTPTFAGSVTYSIKVTDSLGNTATVAAPCPLGVGGRGNPCDFSAPAPSTDNQFELIRVVASLKPLTHTPVRGRS